MPANPVADQMGNQLLQCIGQVLNQFLDHAVQNLGMPADVAQQIRAGISQIMGQIPGSQPMANTAGFGNNAGMNNAAGLNNAIGLNNAAGLNNATGLNNAMGQNNAVGLQNANGSNYQDLIRQISNSLLRDMQGLGGGQFSGMGNAGGGGGRVTSWYTALAKALGMALNRSADKVEMLAGKVNSTFGSDGKVASEGKNFDAMTDLQGETRVLQMLMEAVKNTITSIGDACVSGARKQ